MPDPGVQPVKAAELAAENVLHATVDDGRGVALQIAADGHDVAADLRMRPEFHVAHHRDGVAVDFAVDVVAAKNGDRILA